MNPAGLLEVTSVRRLMPGTVRVKFTGYWRRRLTQDDAPTAGDLADAAEKLGG